jgi:hypothetical protein
VFSLCSLRRKSPLFPPFLKKSLIFHIKIQNNLVKHELKEVLKYKGRSLDPPPVSLLIDRDTQLRTEL